MKRHTVFKQDGAATLAIALFLIALLSASGLLLSRIASNRADGSRWIVSAAKAGEAAFSGAEYAMAVHYKQNLADPTKMSLLNGVYTLPAGEQFRLSYVAADSVSSSSSLVGGITREFWFFVTATAPNQIAPAVPVYP